MRFLLDPKFFNYLIMALYCCNSLRWAINYLVMKQGYWGDMAYWLAALAITVSVTFGYKHG